jgi:hypothetical protein
LYASKRSPMQMKKINMSLSSISYRNVLNVEFVSDSFRGQVMRSYTKVGVAINHSL